MTHLSPELEQAARDFGLALRRHEAVQQYLQAAADLATDAEAGQLDERFAAMRGDLMARQRAGEELPVEQVRTFYALREEIVGNALVHQRDHALTIAKGYLANVGADLNRAVGVDFVTIALS